MCFGTFDEFMCVFEFLEIRFLYVLRGILMIGLHCRWVLCSASTCAIDYWDQRNWRPLARLFGLWHGIQHGHQSVMCICDLFNTFLVFVYCNMYVVGLGRGSFCRLIAMHSITRFVLLVLWALSRTSQVCSELPQLSMCSPPASESQDADANSWCWLGASPKAEPLTSLCLRGRTQCGFHSRRL